MDEGYYTTEPEDEGYYTTEPEDEVSSAPILLEPIVLEEDGEVDNDGSEGAERGYFGSYWEKPK